MLAPTERSLLLNHFRPPDGYRFDSAIGTTYSLDLVALMMVPLAFTFLDIETAAGDPVDDAMAPLALLEALRRHASAVTLFCHAGGIAVPARHRPLFTYLEDSVFESLPDDIRGAFHAKVWLLRYLAEGQPVRIRLLNFSRNLTFDRSWDTVLSLDGEVADRRYGFSSNMPLREFVEALPRWSRRELSEDRRESVERFTQEVHRVRWSVPSGFDPEIRFWPMGVAARAYRRPFPGRPARFFVMSPFVEEGFRDLVDVQLSKRDTLISTPEALDRLAQTRNEIARYEQVFVIDDAGAREALGAPAADEDGGDREPAGSSGDTKPPVGLHAKVFVAEEGWKARMWVGSANATPAAFTRNVEFLTELRGSRAKIGIDALMGNGTEAVGLRDLLVPYQPTPTAADADQVSADDALNKAFLAVASSTAVAAVEEEGSAYSVTLELTFGTDVPEGTRLSCRPLTLGPNDAQSLELEGGRVRVEFRGLSLPALSAFFVFDLTATRGAQTANRHFVRRVDLLGAPEGRAESVLRQILRDRSQVLRYILFLLSLDDSTGILDMAADELSEAMGNRSRGLWSEEALLESLVRSLARDPKRLDSVDRLLGELRGDGRDDLIPAGFLDIWMPVWEARLRLEERRP